MINSADGEDAPDAVVIPMVRLLAIPEDFDRKVVQIVGVVSADYEEVAVYPDEGSYANHVLQNAIWLADGTEAAVAEKLGHVAGKWVVITGLFDLNSKGSMNQFVATLEVIAFRPLPYGKRQ